MVVLPPARVCRLWRESSLPQVRPPACKCEEPRTAGCFVDPKCELICLRPTLGLHKENEDTEGRTKPRSDEVATANKRSDRRVRLAIKPDSLGY